MSFMGVDPFSRRFAPDWCPHFCCGPVPPRPLLSNSSGATVDNDRVYCRWVWLLFIH